MNRLRKTQAIQSSFIILHTLKVTTSNTTVQSARLRLGCRDVIPKLISQEKFQDKYQQPAVISLHRRHQFCSGGGRNFECPDRALHVYVYMFQFTMKFQFKSFYSSLILYYICQLVDSSTIMMKFFSLLHKLNAYLPL